MDINVLNEIPEQIQFGTALDTKESFTFSAFGIFFILIGLALIYLLGENMYLRCDHQKANCEIAKGHSLSASSLKPNQAIATKDIQFFGMDTNYQPPRFALQVDNKIITVSMSGLSGDDQKYLADEFQTFLEDPNAEPIQYDENAGWIIWLLGLFCIAAGYLILSRTRTYLLTATKADGDLTIKRKSLFSKRSTINIQQNNVSNFEAYSVQPNWFSVIILMLVMRKLVAVGAVQHHVRVITKNSDKNRYIKLPLKLFGVDEDAAKAIQKILQNWYFS